MKLNLQHPTTEMNTHLQHQTEMNTHLQHPTEMNTHLQHPIPNQPTKPIQPPSIPSNPTSSTHPLIQPAKSLEQATDPDMEGLEDIDLSNLGIEMSPQDPTPVPVQSVPPGNPLPPTIPLRNQAMMQGIQQNIVHRSVDGSPMIRTPLQGNPNPTHEMMNTVQGNAFSMKRTTPYISF